MINFRGFFMSWFNAKWFLRCWHWVLLNFLIHVFDLLSKLIIGHFLKLIFSFLKLFLGMLNFLSSGWLWLSQGVFWFNRQSLQDILHLWFIYGANRTFDNIRSKRHSVNFFFFRLFRTTATGRKSVFMFLPRLNAFNRFILEFFKVASVLIRFLNFLLRTFSWLENRLLILRFSYNFRL